MVHLGRRFFREAFAACASARNEEEKREGVSTCTCQSQVSLKNKEAKKQRNIGEIQMVSGHRPSQKMKKN
jgi:hypothetical protein